MLQKLRKKQCLIVSKYGVNRCDSLRVTLNMSQWEWNKAVQYGKLNKKQLKHRALIWIKRKNKKANHIKYRKI